jgi:type II secretory pathway component PulF
MALMDSELSPPAALRPADTAELAAGVAELTKAGLPLAGGLRALAEELPGRRIRSALSGMAARMERGEALDAILNSVTGALPLDLHGLLVAGLRSGRLPELMEEYAQVEQERRHLRQRLQFNLAYLMFLALAVTLFSFFIEDVFLKQMGSLIGQQRGTVPGAFSVMAWELFGQVPWLSAGFVAFLALTSLSISNFRAANWLAPISNKLPFFGPLTQNLRLASFSRVMALLIENGTPLPEVIGMAGAAAGDVFLSRGCREVAGELKRGRPLAESLAADWRFPRNWIPLIEWGQRTHALPEAFRVAAQLHEDRAKNQVVLIRTIFAPLMFLFLAGFVCLAGSVISMPAISSLQYLMSGAWFRRTGPSFSIFVPDRFDFSSTFSPVLLGMAILVAKRLVTLRHDHANENLIEMALRTAGWTLIAVGLTGNLLPMMGGLLCLFIPAWIVVGLFIAMKRRRAMQLALLGTMAVSAERFIPLVPAMEAFADDIRGRFAFRVRRLASLLRSGVGLSAAIKRVGRVVPRQLVPTIRVASECGALSRGLAEAAKAEDQHNALWGPFAAKMLYIAAMPCVGMAFLGVMLGMSFNYQRTLKQFSFRPSGLTQKLLEAFSFATTFWPLATAVAIFFAILFLYAVLRYLGVPLFDPPGVERMLRRQHTSAILDNLALAVECSRPLPAVIQTLSECYPKKSIRTRLGYVLYDLAHGGSWDESLFRRGLIRKSDLAVLQSAECVGNLSWALRELADSNRRRLAQWLNVVMQLLFPPVVLCFGAVVCFVVVAMFMPLIQVITALS